MNPLTSEWVEKAEGDLVTAHRELRARNKPNYDATCFHAQQAVEKYLKATLQEANREIPRTHNLIELVSLCLEIDPTYAVLEAELRSIDGYAVLTRYPGQKAGKEEARSAFTISKNVCLFLQKKLSIN
jgi:HEPN domain-containing protein